MKKPHVLNRPMFNTGGTSAYGRGITSNLVSDEQRQRFNYGGRVGYVDRGYVHGSIPGGGYGSAYSHLGQPNDPFHQRPELWYTPTQSTTARLKKKLFGIDTEEDLYEKVYGEAAGDVSIHGLKPEKLYESQTVPPYKARVGPDIVTRELFEEPVDEEKIEEARDVGMTVEEKAAAEADIEDKGNITGEYELRRLQKQMEEEEKSKALTGEGAGAGIANTDMLDIGEIVDKYYDKKAAAGEGLWRMAGAFATASQQSKKDAMATLGKEFGAVGQTLATDKKTRDKLKATGEIQREIYRQSRIAKGEADIKTAEAKEKIVQARPDKETTAADTLKYFRLTKNMDFHDAVKATLGADVIVADSATEDIATMKKIPNKVYQIKVGKNTVYKMYDENNLEIPDFDIEEYIKLLG